MFLVLICLIGIIFIRVLVMKMVFVCFSFDRFVVIFLILNVLSRCVCEVLGRVVYVSEGVFNCLLVD